LCLTDVLSSSLEEVVIRRTTTLTTRMAAKKEIMAADIWIVINRLIVTIVIYLFY
jgi:hypothetical protein